MNLTVTYTDRENYEEDDIIFLRNDNVYKGDLYDGDDTIELPPGIYKVISEKMRVMIRIWEKYIYSHRAKLLQ